MAKAKTAKKKITSDQVKNVMDQIMEIYTILYFFALIVFVAFWVKGGYGVIAGAKHDAFLWSSRIYFYGAIPLAFVRRLFSREKWRISVTDILILALGVVFFLSYIFTPWQEVAWGGYPGWFMGFRTWLICIGIYFAASRGLRNRRSIEIILCATVITTALVCLWGGIDSLLARMYGTGSATMRPIQLEGLITDEGVVLTNRIGPLGNVDWFACWYSIFFPLTLGLLFVVKNKKQKIVLLIAVLIGVFQGIVEEADSTRIVLIVCALFFWWMCFWHFDSLSKKQLWIRRIPVLAVVGGAAVIVILIIINTYHPGSIGSLSNYGFFTFNRDWGTQRGANFEAAIRTFDEIFFTYQTVGVGEDCFPYGVYGIEEVGTMLNEVHNGATLTNAHNELMTMLINSGILGVGLFFGTSIYTGIRGVVESNDKKKRILMAFTIPIFAYLLHNIVSFATTFNTPYLFLMIGFIENYRSYYKYRFEPVPLFPGIKFPAFGKKAHENG